MRRAAVPSAGATGIKNRSMPRSFRIRTSDRLSKPTRLTIAAKALAASFLANGKKWVCFFLSNQRETPIRARQASLFAFVVTGAALQLSRLAM